LLIQKILVRINIIFLGDRINIEFHLENRSLKEIRLQPQLQQKAEFWNDDMSLDSEKEIAYNYSDFCQRYNSFSGGINIIIPNDCLSTIDSPLFKIKYEIIFYVDVSGTFEYFQSTPIFIK
jgi:hypothetical protein